MTGVKAGVRAAVDRFLKTYFDRVADDVGPIRDEVVVLSGQLNHSLATMAEELRGELGALEATTASRFAELATQRARDDEKRAEDVKKAHEAFDRLEARAAQLQQRFGDVEATVVRQLEGQALRQAELREAMDDPAKGLKHSMEKLELLFLEQLEGLFGAVHGETAALRSDIAELARMLRMQGDAADEVAEVMGRTLARLSAEVEVLGDALGKLAPRREKAPTPA